MDHQQLVAVHAELVEKYAALEVAYQLVKDEYAALYAFVNAQKPAQPETDNT